MIQIKSIYFKALQRQKTIRIYTPQQYDTTQLDKQYPVLFMHDGQNLFHDEEASFGKSWRLKEMIDQMGLELIVVGIDCAEERSKRYDEYGPWETTQSSQDLLGVEATLGGEGNAYIEGIVNDLLPYIRSEYRIDPAQIAMAGSSMGGLISTYAACMYPHIFRKVASLSSAFWFNQEEIESLVRKCNVSSLTDYYFDIGTNEQTATITPDDYVEASLSFEKIIQETNIPYTFRIIDGAEHDERAWRERFPEVLLQLIK